MPTRLAWFYSYRFFAACLPYLPVTATCFLAVGLGWSEVALLSAVYCVGSVLLAVPLGALCDRHGYKKSVVLGAIMLALGGIIAALADSLSAFVVAQIVFAAASALDGGADSAYLFHTLARQGGAPATYRACEARSTSCKLLGNVAGFSLGGALAAWTPFAPFAVAAGFALVAALCATRLDDIPAVAARRLDLAHLAASARELGRAADRHRVLALAVATAALARYAATTTAPYLASQDVSLVTIGFLAAAGALVAALVAQRSHIVADRIGVLTALALLPVVLVAGQIAVGVGPRALAVVLALLPPAIAGIHAPLWRAHLNERIRDSSRRATVLAMDAALARLACAGLALVTPLLVGADEPRSELLCGTLIAAAVVLLAIAFAPRGARRRAGQRGRMASLRLVWAVTGLLALLFTPSASRDAAAEDLASQPRVALAAHEVVAAAAGPVAGAAEASTARPARFLDHDDDELLAALCQQPLSKLKNNRNGTTIKFKGTLPGGIRASLRPAQVLPQGSFRAEIASYQVSRLLGLGTVAPACERTMSRSELFAAADETTRKRMEDELLWSRDGQSVKVSVVYWVEGVESAALENTRAHWHKLLRQDQELAGADDLLAAAIEGSRLATWDFLIANWDRWSGANTFRVGARGPFVWLDNAAGFGGERATTRARRAGELYKVERFSRSLITAIRAVRPDELRAALAGTGLSSHRVSDFLARRELLLAHIDRLVTHHGEAAVLSFE